MAGKRKRKYYEMTNIYATPEKVQYAKRLFEIGVEYLEGQGYEVSRVPRAGKKSLRHVKKGKESFNVAIRTSQDQWFAFPRDDDGNWMGMDDVKVEKVIVVALNTREAGKEKIGLVHMFEADEVRKRLNKNYKARVKANPNIDISHGNWISLYHKEANDPLSMVAAGIGNDFPPLDRVPLVPGETDVDEEDLEEADEPTAAATPPAGPTDDGPLTIPEAKRRLALTFGVEPSAIKITVEG